MSPRRTVYPHPAVAVDVVVFTLRQQALQVLLIRRGNPPYKGSWAFPGGFVEYDESLDDAARRELKEETNVDAARLVQFYTFGQPDRDPRMRVISVAYWALLRAYRVRLRAGDDACEARWFSVAHPPRLAFDHREMLSRAIQALYGGLCYSDLSSEIVPKSLTSTHLKRIYEVLPGKKLVWKEFHKLIEPHPTIQKGLRRHRSRTPGSRR